ncbi:DUF354 domain-containing protein [Halomonas daqingensis]|uniref:DUF354 domain-containing protein n=1 Tax=Billgrantia desiderata TaxID=52021 RepID=A0ABS9B0H7_9GAMM|nr:DUF354 domain-containing protein [Halomonas desiderata]MCE8040709.1 DUF354 domain-containing protein [Halomonas desiderata]MCE8045284.1 DUF354 domain-containing protein [Halomonas desiderata]
MKSNSITSVLLVESHKRTISWAKALLALNQVNLHVLVVIPDEREVYLDIGVPSENIHNINEVNALSPLDDGKGLDIERGFYYCINAIISSDRLLRRKSYEESVLYLNRLIEYFNKVLDENKIEMVILEPTWAHEILMCEVAKAKAIKSYFPHTMRIPYKHFLFFNGYRQEEFFKRDKSEFNNSDALAAYNSIVHKGEKPLYFHKNNNKNNFSLTLLSKPFKGLVKEFRGEKNLYVTPRVHRLIIDKVSKITRRQGVSLLVDFDQPKNEDNYVFVSLHVQPESSIDVLGNMYTNQIEYVRAIAKTTPSSHKVYVKEHSNALGDRPLGFYRDMRDIPGVVLVDPNLDSHALMKKADLVISVSGTTSFEASLMGVPAVTSAKMFFSDLLVKEQFNPYGDNVRDLIKEGEVWKKRFGKEELMQCYYHIFKNSFEGDTTDCLTNPSVLEEGNIEKLSKAFNELVSND